MEEKINKELEICLKEIQTNKQKRKKERKNFRDVKQKVEKEKR